MSIDAIIAKHQARNRRAVAALSSKRLKGARAAFLAHWTAKATPATIRRLPDPLDGVTNPDRRDDFVDLIADVLILARELGMDAAYIARVGASHVGDDALTDDAAAHGIDPDED